MKSNNQLFNQIRIFKRDKIGIGAFLGWLLIPLILSYISLVIMNLVFYYVEQNGKLLAAPPNYLFYRLDSNINNISWYKYCKLVLIDILPLALYILIPLFKRINYASFFLFQTKVLIKNENFQKLSQKYQARYKKDIAFLLSYQLSSEFKRDSRFFLEYDELNSDSDYKNAKKKLFFDSDTKSARVWILFLIWIIFIFIFTTLIQGFYFLNQSIPDLSVDNFSKYLIFASEIFYKDTHSWIIYLYSSLSVVIFIIFKIVFYFINFNYFVKADVKLKLFKLSAKQKSTTRIEQCVNFYLELEHDLDEFKTKSEKHDELNYQKETLNKEFNMESVNTNLDFDYEKFKNELKTEILDQIKVELDQIKQNTTQLLEIEKNKINN